MRRIIRALGAIKFFVLKIIGLIFIVIGSIGLFLPIIPGAALIALGLALMGSKYVVHGARHIVLKAKLHKNAK
jgi:uncharacterized protein YqgC (DUF456 family)